MVEASERCDDSGTVKSHTYAVDMESDKTGISSVVSIVARSAAPVNAKPFAKSSHVESMTAHPLDLLRALSAKVQWR